jgi:hypothetical protein
VNGSGKHSSLLRYGNNYGPKCCVVQAREKGTSANVFVGPGGDENPGLSCLYIYFLSLYHRASAATLSRCLIVKFFQFKNLKMKLIKINFELKDEFDEAIIYHNLSREY